MARDSRNSESRKKGGPGRGIETLFEDTPAQVVQSVDGTEEVEELNLKDTRPNPYRPRKNFDDKSLKELSDSIKENGIFQPIIARKSLDGYEIIAGERRSRTSKLAKGPTIPTIVRDFDETQVMEVAVLENLQREDLSPSEEAQAYKMFQKNLGLTQEEVSKRMGKSRPYIANYLRLLTLSKKAKKLLQHGELLIGQARTLLGLRNKNKIDDLVKKVVKEGIPVKKLEALVSAMNEEADKTSRNDKIRKSAFIRASESRLSTRFGNPVSTSESKKGKGHLSIDFSSAGDLDRILIMLGIDLDD